MGCILTKIARKGRIVARVVYERSFRKVMTEWLGCILPDNVRKARIEWLGLYTRRYCKEEWDRVACVFSPRDC